MSHDFNSGGVARRSFFLIGFAWAANIFLLGFGLDATLSTIDETLRMVASFDGLSDIRNFVAGTVFWMAFLVPFLVIFVSHLPKGVLLPPAIFAVWAGTGLSPFSLAVDNEAINLLFQLLQFAIFAASLDFNRRRSGHWLILASDLPRKGHLLLRTLGAIGISIVLLPVMLAGLAVVS